MMFNFRRKISIGIAAENRPAERRVVLLPRQLRHLARHHRIMVEKGAGLGIGITDADYASAGIKVVPKDKVYKADLVVRITAPREGELKLMKPGKFVMCMLHVRARPRLAGLLRKYRINVIALEEIRNQFNERRVEALHETGYLGMTTGFDLWGKDPARAMVKVMGYGHVAWGAVQAAARKFSRVIILNKRDINEMDKHLPGTDILVNALNWPYDLRGRVFLVKRQMLKLLKPGAVIVDLVANPEGQSPIETCRPTTLADLSYKVDGVIHTCCWGWPGLDPESITKRYSIQIGPILSDIVKKGLNALPPYLVKAVFKGKQ
ncbi:MAG: hypothetical protein JW782_00155 [Candidatus Saganbacteria bacterium]|nr:hypothetical protein [Candidatus Saganbacteria bacterium]